MAQQPPVDIALRQRRALISLVGSAVLIVMSLLGLQLWSGREATLRDAATRTHNYAAIIEARLDTTLRRTDSVLLNLLHELPAQALAQSAVPSYAAELGTDLDRDLVNFAELAGLRVFDANGELLYSSATERTPRSNIADRAYFRRVRDDRQAGLVFSEVITITSTGRRGVVGVRALRDPKGTFQGVVLAVIELSHFEALFKSLDVGAKGVVVIRRSDDFSGVVRWPTLEREINRPLPPGNPVRDAMQAGKPAGTLSFPASSDGVLRTYSYRSVNGYPFFVLVALSHDDALADWRARTLAIGVSGLLLLALLATLLARLWQTQAREARAMAAMQTSEERLRLALAASGQGLYDLDVQTGETVVDAQYARMLGYDPVSFRETNDAWIERLHPDDRERVAQAYRDYVAGKTVEYRIEFRQRTTEGPYKWILSIGKVVERDAQGSPRRMLGTHLDISELKQAELALKQVNLELESRVQARTAELVLARDEAERASRAKSDFLSAMSHELRTPMNAILGFSQLLESDPSNQLTERQLDQVRHIHRAGDHLLELINDVLDLARVEAGKQPVSLEPVSVAALLNDCLSLMQPVARDHGIRLPSLAPASCECFVTAAGTRLKQVLLNLISNAIKYNRAGGSVEINCAAEGDTVRIGIGDSGPGLTADECARLFNAFDRLGADAGIVQGAGIGLVLSKRLVELMHGSIGVDSVVGQGSTFWIRLARSTPLAERTQPEPRARSNAAPAQLIQGLRTVLYIEDDPVNLLLVEAMLAREPGVRLITAPLPGLGLELAHAQQPDLILLDIQLPGIDGYEVLRRLRDAEATRAIPVIAISANAMHGDIERGLAAGFGEYLTKPLDVSVLLAALRRALHE